MDLPEPSNDAHGGSCLAAGILASGRTHGSGGTRHGISSSRPGMARWCLVAEVRHGWRRGRGMSEGVVDVVYRGQFQGRRIRLILDALDRLARPVNFMWVHPGGTTRDPPDLFHSFIASRPSIVGSSYVGGSPGDVPRIVRSLFRTGEARSDVAVAIGFTSLSVARLLRPRYLIWCMNGIPEERLLHHDGTKDRAVIAAQWRMVRLGRTPDVAVTVSKPMSTLLRSRLGLQTVLELPTAVDRSVFVPTQKDKPPLLVYVGSGAPWQNLDLLGSVWREIARRLPDASFRVVSRDPRARVAIEGIPAVRCDLVAGHGADHVAQLTAGASHGFVIRRPHLVNEVSFPTKFGEYVASNTEVVTTDIGWELGSIVKETGCGLVVDWQGSPQQVADQIVDHMACRDVDIQRQACELAAGELDRDRWIATVGEQLKGLVP